MTRAGAAGTAGRNFRAERPEHPANALSAPSPSPQPPGASVDPPAVTRGYSGHTAGQGAEG